MYSAGSEAKLIEGPLFTNVVLADELNRTTPRTQSALLEAMQEYQVTIERKTFPLAKPFIVIATQVQAGGEGTYPLTDVQIDRFLLRVASDYPSLEEEKEILRYIDHIDEPDVHVVTSLEEILELQQTVKTVQVSEGVLEYIVSLVSRLRGDPDVLSGPSTRGSVALYKCSRALALLDGRDFVIPDDVKHLAPLALEHRLKVKPEAEMDEVTPRVILERALEQVPVPRVNI